MVSSPLACSRSWAWLEQRCLRLPERRARRYGPPSEIRAPGTGHPTGAPAEVGAGRARALECRGVAEGTTRHASAGGPSGDLAARRRQALRRDRRPSTASTSRCRAGVCFGLLGPNGAGKSTTMRMLTAQALADEGEIEVLGYELPRESKQARMEMGVVPQLDNLDVELTCRQILTVFARLYRVPARRARRRRRARAGHRQPARRAPTRSCASSRAACAGACSSRAG